MEFSAINHSMDKRYCYALENGEFVFRIKTKKGDMNHVLLHYQDKYIPLKICDTSKMAEMSKIASDEYCDYYEVKIEIDVICLRYYFELMDQKGEVYYYGNYEFYSMKIKDIDHMFDCPQNLREEERFIVPSWSNNQVVYQIFPARFASSVIVEKEYWYRTPIDANTDLKGDLKGIISRLGYLKELGVDVIYMTPIFQADSIHKYDTIDYYTIDPSLGTEIDLKNLIDQAHEMGIKVILDGVFNHTSSKFFAFEDIRRNQENSKYKDWYYLKGFPLKTKRGEKPNYKSFGYYGGMPKLNLQNPETQLYFIQVGCYWMEQFHIDGWRLDVGDEISHSFWKAFRKAIKEVNPEALLIGEVWHCAGDFLEGDEWDTVMNYPFYFSVMDFVAEETISASKFWSNLNYLRGNLHNKVIPILWNLIDSHDTPRFFTICKEKKEKLKLAAGLQMLLPGMPVIYYGDEFGMTGGQDPDCRRGMLWDSNYQDKEIYLWYKSLIHIRKRYGCITEGKIDKVKIEDENGLLIIEKKWEGERVVIGFHGKDGNIKFPMYQGMKNLLKNELFDGTIEGYEVFVLC